MKNKVLFLILITGLVACKKANERACFKVKGDIITTETPISKDIKTLELHDDIIYTLVPGKESKVVLEGGENLLPFIDIQSENGNLTLRNENKCKFLRSLKNKIYASIYIDSISTIEYFGSRGLKSEGTIHSNQMRLLIKDGAGEVNLTLKNGYTAATVANGVGNFILNGQTVIAYLHCNSNGYCDTRGFKISNKLNVTSNTQGDMLVNANNVHFKATIQENGNIKYTGNPTDKDVSLEGNGQLIPIAN